MKIIFTLILINSFYCGFAQQSTVPDTIDLTDAGKIFLVMKEDIVYVDFGTKDVSFFSQEIKKNVLKVMATKPFPMTTLWVALANKEYQLFIIRYKKNTHKWQYDYSGKAVVAVAQPPKPVVVPIEAETSFDTSQFDLGIVKKRKNMIYDEKEKIEDIVSVKNNLMFSVTNIKNDNNCTYIALNIKNKSSVDYKVDIIQFNVVEKLKKGGAKNNITVEEIKPVIPTELRIINGYDNRRVVYALPIFATGDGNANGLEVILKEELGTRQIKLEIPIKEFTKAEVF